MTRASTAVRGSQFPAPVGANRLGPGRARTGWATHPAATGAARTPERSAAESYRGRRGSRRPRGAAGTERDTGAPRPLRSALLRGSGQARASRARRPPRPPPAATATPPGSRQLFPSQGLGAACPLAERSPGQPWLQRDAWRPLAEHTAGSPALVFANTGGQDLSGLPQIQHFFWMQFLHSPYSVWPFPETQLI